MKRRIIGGLAVCLALALGVTACSSGGDSGSGGSSTSKAMKATILTNYYAQAEQGGYWAAKAEGLAAKRGVDLTVKQGGPGIQTIPQVAAGKADFGVGNADDIAVAASHGVPIVAVMTGFKQNIFGFAYHKSAGITGFSDLNGKTVARRPSAYWSYIKKHFHLTSAKEINVGSLASFRHNKNLVQQIFLTHEPATLKKMGVTDVGYLSVAKDGGYNSYQNMLFTSQSFIDNHPDTVKAVVASVADGWRAMLKDPTKTKKLIVKTNPDGDPEVFDYGLEKLRTDTAILGKRSKIGSMTDARWKELDAKLVDIGQLPKDFDIAKAYTLKYSTK